MNNLKWFSSENAIGEHEKKIVVAAIRAGVWGGGVALLLNCLCNKQGLQNKKYRKDLYKI